MDRKDWMIGVCSSGSEGIMMYRFFGTVDEVKQKLLDMVNEDRFEDSDGWDYGSESLEDVSDVRNGAGVEFYAYGVYGDYHIDYTALNFENVVYG